MRYSRFFISSLLLAPVTAQAGIPQLEQTEWFASQLFWLAITFALMVLLVRLFIAPTIGNVLKEREDAIRNAATDAERARLAAQQAQNSSSDTMRTAREKAAQMAGTAKQQADEKSAKQNKDLDGEITSQLEKANQQISAAKDEALKSLESEAATLAESLRDKLIQANGSNSLKAAS